MASSVRMLIPGVLDRPGGFQGGQEGEWGKLPKGELDVCAPWGTLPQEGCGVSGWGGVARLDTGF